MVFLYRKIKVDCDNGAALKKYRHPEINDMMSHLRDLVLKDVVNK